MASVPAAASGSAVPSVVTSIHRHQDIAPLLVQLVRSLEDASAEARNIYQQLRLAWWPLARAVYEQRPALALTQDPRIWSEFLRRQVPPARLDLLCHAIFNAEIEALRSPSTTADLRARLARAATKLGVSQYQLYLDLDTEVTTKGHSLKKVAALLGLPEVTRELLLRALWAEMLERHAFQGTNGPPEITTRDVTRVFNRKLFSSYLLSGRFVGDGDPLLGRILYRSFVPRHRRQLACILGSAPGLASCTPAWSFCRRIGQAKGRG